MPYKDPLKAKEAAKRRYKERPHLWKNNDGSWKRVSNYGTDEYRQSKREWYHRNKLEVQRKIKEKRDKKRKFGLCEICSIPCNQHYDHNHSTNQFRGWLCLGCNLAIGHAKESPWILSQMILYLLERGRMTGLTEKGQ